jgi:hypothetical protein
LAGFLVAGIGVWQTNIKAARELEDARIRGSEQEFGGNRILGRFRQMVIFRPDRRHALAFSSRYRRFLYPNEGEVGSKTFRQVRVFG